jgi:hypothetical protein
MEEKCIEHDVKVLMDRAFQGSAYKIGTDIRGRCLHILGETYHLDVTVM